MQFRIGEKTYTAEAAEAEVRRLRALPDAQVRALQGTDLWHVALGAIDPLQSWKAAQQKAAENEPSRTVDYRKLQSVLALCDPDDERTIEGIATTPSGNSHGYALDAAGVEYELPLPLCLAHDTRRRLGWVVAASASSTAVRFTAKLAKRGMYPEADETWARIVDGEMAGVSTGFESARDWRVDRVDVDRVAGRWRWTELTVCPIGANQDAQIQRVFERRHGKHYDWPHRTTAALPRPAVTKSAEPADHQSLAAAIRQLEATLREPILPIYNTAGELVGAQRGKSNS